MDNATVAIIGKLVIAIVLAGGGIAAMFLGRGLYREGVGLTPEKTTVEVFKKVKITTSSVGAVLMLTAVAWGWLAKDSFQQYSRGEGGGVTVASIIPPGGNSIAFSPTKADLDSASKVALQKDLDWLRASPNSYIAVSGVATKADGSENARTKIAERRADAVKDYLVKSGIEPNRITTFKMIWNDATDESDLQTLYSPSAKLTMVLPHQGNAVAHDPHDANMPL